MSRFSLPRDASDEELMRRVQNNDVDAFEQLFDRHAALSFRVARSVSHDANRAEDAVQEGFLAVWRSRANFRPDAGSFRTWSMRIVRHRAIDLSRREVAGHRPQTVDVGEGALPDRTGGSIEHEVVARTEGDALRASLSQLPEAQAEVIALAFFGELTHTEIANQLALPAGTVKGRMRLGLERLRTQLAASG